jgi:hypothetical protein
LIRHSKVPVSEEMKAKLWFPVAERVPERVPVIIVVSGAVWSVTFTVLVTVLPVFPAISV